MSTPTNSGNMASIESRIVSAVLSAIRTHRDEPSVSQRDSVVHSAVAAAPAKLREALLSDFSAVADLKQRWSLAADSFQNWERLWRHNPALAQMPSVPPIGWVLEAEGAIVGYLGNISSLYRYGNRTLTAVTAHGFVVDPPYRSVGVSLVAAYFRQRSVDLYVSTTAIEAVGKIARAFRADPLPQADYETVLFWVLKPYPFAHAVVKKLGLNALFSRVGGVVGSFAVASDKLLHRRWPVKSSMRLSVTEMTVGEIGEQFKDLWAEKVREMPRLLADRSPVTLRWHFEIPGDKGNVRVLCCSRNGKLLGYAVIRDEAPDQTNGLRKSIIADLLAKEDDPTVTEALMFAAYGHAKQAGSHVLELMGFPPSIRRVCAKWHPYMRKYPSCPFHYKAADPVLHAALAEGSAWYASPFDGDATLIRDSYSSSGGASHPSKANPEGFRNEIARDVPNEERTPVL